MVLMAGQGRLPLFDLFHRTRNRRYPVIALPSGEGPFPKPTARRSRSTAVDRGEGNEGGPGFRKVLESPGETPVSSEPGQRGFERSVPQVTSTVRARRTRSTAKCAAISQVGMCVTSHSFLDCSVPGTRCPVDNDCRRANRASQVNGVRDGQRRRKSTEAVLAPRRESALAGLHW